MDGEWGANALGVVSSVAGISDSREEGGYRVNKDVRTVPRNLLIKNYQDHEDDHIWNNMWFQETVFGLGQNSEVSMFTHTSLDWATDVL